MRRRPETIVCRAPSRCKAIELAELWHLPREPFSIRAWRDIEVRYKRARWGYVVHSVASHVFADSV
jgi:hypothetical protein